MSNTMEAAQKTTSLGKPGRSSSKATIALLVLAVVVMGGVYMAFRGTKVTTEPVNNPSTLSQLQAGKVSMTAGGFSPETITIKAGDTVTWTNADSAAHQVATDPYPSEDALASFKAANPALQNATYSYRFTKAGTYTYHDHLAPLKFKGTVVVQ